MIHLRPHLTFRGECRTAFRFYERVFGARLETLLTYGEAPGGHDVPEEMYDKILHATLCIGDYALFGADVPLDEYAPPGGFAVTVDIDDADEARRIFDALAERGTVRLPLQEMFWSPAFGIVVDRFNVPWEINALGAASEG